MASANADGDPENADARAAIADQNRLAQRSGIIVVINLTPVKLVRLVLSCSRKFAMAMRTLK